MMIIRKPSDIKAEKVEMDGVKGAFKQLMLGSDDGVPGYSVRVFTLEPGGHTPRHSHAPEHLNYIISGRGELVDPEGNARPVNAGDFAMVEPEELHQFRNAGDEPFVFICAVPKEYE
jgi:quercetin dioxygenase-like cupin family protein